jgi:LysM repeat protein
MEEYFPAPERRYPSPSAQRRSGEHWKARLGLGFVILLTLISAAIMFRIAGLGVGTATSALRGQSPSPPPRPSAAATVPSPSGQPPGNQPAAAPAQPPVPTAAPAAGAATAVPSPPAPAVPTPTTVATPTARLGQREHTVQAGDTLFAIAQRYTTTVDAIVAANNLQSRNVTLRVGQVLVIP